ncbi:DUF881 domain-containing protein [Clostridium sediminicola]|uniref:DUF881 domain-containing protein n=1 Tax=Clostridium sediminicola TaxID=3114879 RepID=UPI0031F26417
MKKNEAKIFLFIASILLGILISSNIVIQDTNKRIYLTPTEYIEAHNKKNKLMNEIENLRNLRYEHSEKLETYKESFDSNDKVMNEMKDELALNYMILGKADVEGEGISIELRDAESYNNDSMSIIHDFDMRNLINDLKNAGAEVISINGQRVTDQTHLLCNGPLIEVNWIKYPQPFIVNAIGDKEKLISYMESEGNCISFLRIRGIRVRIKKSDDIRIYAFNGKLNENYMHELKLEDKSN